MLENKETLETEDLDDIKRIKSNEYITMSNELIDASYKLGLVEHRLYSYLLSKVKKSDPNWNIVSINIKDFAKKFDIEHKAVYDEVKKASRKLQKTQIVINKTDTKNKKSKSSNEEPYLFVSWLSSAEYKDGVLEAEFSKKLEPYLLGLKKNFTKCDINELAKFSSNYAIRLYQILKRYAEFDYNVKEFSIEQFRFTLALENKYPKFSNLRIRVIDKALEEINEKSDIVIDMIPMKKGKKVASIKFVVKPKVVKLKEVDQVKEPDKDLSVDETLIVTVKTLLGTIMPEVKEQDAIVLLEEAKNDINKIMKQIMNVQSSKSPIDNIIGYLRSAIRGNYESISFNDNMRTNPIKNYTDDSDNEDWEALTDKASSY